jgi:hypothetical protein
VVVQIKTLIPAMISSVGTTVFGPPANTRTGHEVRTITTFRSADLRTMLRNLGAVDSSSLRQLNVFFSVGEFMFTPCPTETKHCELPLAGACSQLSRLHPGSQPLV